MKFHKVIGKIDQKIIERAEKQLSLVFMELGLSPETKAVVTKLGGNPLLFSLIFPMQHIATNNIPTAGTNGLKYFWCPEFIISLDLIGLRIVCEHEAFHAIYMHPQRIGARDKRLWNIAVDYVVNAIIMDGLKKRGFDAEDLFRKHLGRFITLSQLLEKYKNPEKPVPGFEDLDKFSEEDMRVLENLPKPEDTRELTEEEIKTLKKILEEQKKNMVFYADLSIPEDQLRPEKIYDILYKAIPKCPECGELGVYDLKPGNGNDECGTCGGGRKSIFGFGDTLDDHMEAEESPEKMHRRISDAIRSAKMLKAGLVPGALEDELGLLTSPQVKWQDVVRLKKHKSRQGNSKNDWTKLRSRPLFAGIVSPKRVNIVANFGCLLDTSGSMSTDDLGYAVSQLQSLDDRAEGWVVPCDTICSWDKAVKLKRMKSEDLLKIKAYGRGGTIFKQFFDDYEKHFGKCDFLIVLTDGYLDQADMDAMKNPGIPVFWVITSGAEFVAPFGKIYQLRN